MAALTVTYPKTANLGGPVKLTYGQFTATAGDAAGTVTVAGGRIIGYQFLDNATSGPVDVKVHASNSSSSGIITVTVYTQATVADGDFWIMSA